MASNFPRSNKDLDNAAEIILVPKKEDVQYHQDPEEFILRLDKIESPSQRLFTMVKSCFYIKDEPTHEAIMIRRMFLAGAFGGMFFGALLSSGQVTSSYIRKYNAAVFDGQYRARRMYYDNLITGLVTRGLGYTFKTSLLVGGAGLVSYGSITCRNKLYFPDWLLGFATLGGLTRLWLGPRAVVVGGLLGSFTGIFGFGLAKGIEAFSGYSVSQLKYLEHTEWLKSRHNRRMRLLAASEKNIKEFQEND